MTPAQALAQAQELLERRDLPGARAALEEAEAQDADPDECSAALWLSHMLAGVFEEAWRQSDALRRRGAPDPHRFWNGEDVRGKRLIVRCVHGFGDTVQMLRYAPRLNALAASVVWEVPPSLLLVARCFVGVENVITWGEAAPERPPEWEVQMEVMELPYFFRTSLAELPVAIEYLRLPREEIDRARSLMGDYGGARVGLAWTSGVWNRSRDVPFSLITELTSTAIIEFWSLQMEAPPLAQLRHQVAVTGDGILALAATIANLDLIITADTLAAHLAGTLGKPCWLMLQHGADWRWMHGRSDSPWYPSLRLFRQPSPGDWGAVIGEIRQGLATLRA